MHSKEICTQILSAKSKQAVSGIIDDVPELPDPANWHSLTDERQTSTWSSIKRPAEAKPLPNKEQFMSTVPTVTVTLNNLQALTDVAEGFMSEAGECAASRHAVL